MRFTRVLHVVAILLVIAIAFTGCNRRNNNTNTSSQPGVVSDIEEGLDDLKSGVEEGIQDGASKVEDLLDMDPSDGEYSDEDGLLNEDDEYSLSSGLLDDDSRLDESTLLEDESIAPAMSTDFAEIGALDAEKLGWGSGGPTDAKRRPDGSTVYQGKYGQYDAYFIAPETNKIYLTFDEGYENSYTPQILDTLKEKDVKAIFFITYPYAQTEPELVKRMVDEGHILGNHSTKHKSFPEISLQEATEDVMNLHEYVKETYNYEMNLFRPPMGEFSEQTLALMQSLGYKSVFWSFAYRDWEVDNQPLTIEALDTVTTKLHPGAIYLLHAVSQTNAEILDEFIDFARSEGYEFASWDL